MKHLFLTLMAILSITTATSQTVVGDATLPNTMSLEGADLLCLTVQECVRNYGLIYMLADFI